VRLYHTGKTEIPDPDIYRGRKNADFGQGFYLSPDRDFTYRWAGRDAVVNEYELDLRGLDVRTLKRDGEWFSYIYSNRRASDGISADVIVGPIANDTIFDTLGIITSGLLEPDEAMQLLMIGPEYTQVVIKSEKAASQLKWLGSERITELDADTRRTEQDEYQTEFVEVMQKIVSERGSGNGVPEG